MRIATVTFRVEQARNAELVLGHVEGVVEVADVVVGVEAVVVDEVGPVRVYERVEAETVAPARREVVDLPRHMRIPEGTTTHMLIPDRTTLASCVNKGRALHIKIFRQLTHSHVLFHNYIYSDENYMTIREQCIR